MLHAPAVCPTARRRYVRGGFTFVELFVVIAIIITLAAITLGIMQGVKRYAATTRARADLSALSQALEQYRRQYGDYPQTADSAEKLHLALTGRLGPTGAALRGRNLMAAVPVSLRDPDHSDDLANYFVDPWDHAYQYVFFTRQNGTAPAQHGYVLFSFGPRNSTESLPTPAEVVPVTAGAQGGVISTAAGNAKNIYAGH